jgi:hypothetical protein
MRRDGEGDMRGILRDRQVTGKSFSSAPVDGIIIAFGALHRSPLAAASQSLHRRRFS